MYGHQGGKEKGGMNWEIAADSYTLLYIKLITYENLLYGTGNSIVLCGDLNGKEIQKGGTICKHIAYSLCCIVDTNSNRNEKKKKISQTHLLKIGI